MKVAHALRDVSAAQYVGTHHVLLALASGTSETVATVLESHGVAPRVVATTVRNYPELQESRPGGSQQSEGKGPNLSSWLVEILRRAFVESEAGGAVRVDVSAANLASTMVSEARCSASKLLVSLEVDAERLAAELALASQ